MTADDIYSDIPGYNDAIFGRDISGILCTGVMAYLLIDVWPIISGPCYIYLVVSE